MSRNMDESRGVSSYLRNPLPFFNPAASPSDGSEVSGNEVEASFGPDQVAEIRAAVAELVVFGFRGTSVNGHARTLISMGEGLLFRF
jgi:hypothetical protein